MIFGTSPKGWDGQSLQNRMSALMPHGAGPPAGTPTAEPAPATAPRGLPSVLDVLASSIHVMQVRITRSRTCPADDAVVARESVGVLEITPKPAEWWLRH